MHTTLGGRYRRTLCLLYSTFSRNISSSVNRHQADGPNKRNGSKGNVAAVLSLGWALVPSANKQRLIGLSCCRSLAIRVHLADI